MPAMSCQTSTCASQLGPAPIPTVGIVSLPVIWVASSAGTISITTANAPASCDGDRVVDGLLGGVAAALDAEPAEAVHALRGEADVRHHRDAGRRQRGDLVGHPLAALQLDRVRAGLLEEARRGGEGLCGASLVAAERQVGDYQRMRRTAHHAADQRDQLVDGHRHGGVVAVHHVGGGVADQEHRDLASSNTAAVE